MASERITCSSCGSVQPAGTSRCSNCGEPVVAVPVVTRNDRGESRRAASPAGPRQQPGKGAAARQQSPRSSASVTTIRLTTPVAIVLVAVAAGLVLLGYAIGIQKSSGTSASDPVPEVNVPSGPQAPTAQELAGMLADVNAHPDDAAARLRYANALHDADKPGLAIEHYRAYLSKEPGNTDAHVDLGVCYFMMKDYDNAITEMRAALKANPRHVMGNYNLGIVLFNKGDKAQARTYFEKVRELSPNSEMAGQAEQMLQSLGK